MLNLKKYTIIYKALYLSIKKGFIIDFNTRELCNFTDLDAKNETIDHS